MEFCCLCCLRIVWSNKPTVCCVYASGCNRIDQTSRVGMHSLLASPTWKQLGYVEKVENIQVIYLVLDLIQCNMANVELLSTNTGYM